MRWELIEGEDPESFVSTHWMAYHLPDNRVHIDQTGF